MQLIGYVSNRINQFISRIFGLMNGPMIGLVGQVADAGRRLPSLGVYRCIEGVNGFKRLINGIHRLIHGST